MEEDFKKLRQDKLMTMQKQERVHFVNSIAGFKSVCLIGTQNNLNQTNLAIVSSLIHIGSNPPLLGVIFRPGVVERHSLENILSTRFFTVNHINEAIYKQAHQTSARYDRAISEFDATGLTVACKDDFFAPFVGESQVQIAMEFKEKVELTINNTVLVIGEVKSVYFPSDCLEEDGFLHIEKAASITCSGLDSYHKTIQLDRLSYAKPDKSLTSIKIN
jgi:flavin reductase (DIM6/NTAB) family NADH-FMN oxidoreductase RutF